MVYLIDLIWLLIWYFTDSNYEEVNIQLIMFMFTYEKINRKWPMAAPVGYVKDQLKKK